VPAFFKTRVTVFFGGIVTSQSPFRAVAVWAKMSLLTHSMVSPDLCRSFGRRDHQICKSNLFGRG
jgi:hypothetical protein